MASAAVMINLSSVISRPPLLPFQWKRDSDGRIACFGQWFAEGTHRGPGPWMIGNLPCAPCIFGRPGLPGLPGLPIAWEAREGGFYESACGTSMYASVESSVSSFTATTRRATPEQCRCSMHPVSLSTFFVGRLSYKKVHPNAAMTGPAVIVPLAAHICFI